MNAAASDRDGLIHDWNRFDPGCRARPRPVQVHDESLRDGVQSPSIVDPSVEDKLRIVQLMEELGIESVNVGLPGAGPRPLEDVTRIGRYKRDHHLAIRMCTAARTLVQDIAPVAEAQQRTGVPLAVYSFIGSSPIRQYAEGWSLDELLRLSTDAIDFAVKEGIEICFVTEDTTRSAPETLELLFRNAMDHGVSALCLCDTVGHATPEGVRHLIGWTRNLIDATAPEVKIDWHGHNDRGLALANALCAAECGADRIHGTVLGFGERVGNTPLDLLLVNLKLGGLIDRDLAALVPFVRLVAKAVHVSIPCNYPLVGDDAFRTGTGVHAAAIVKARRKNDAWLADRIYSSVAAGEYGKEQTIEIGPMSGMSNVSYWLAQRGIEFDEGLCRFILGKAKRADRLLPEETVRAAIRDYEATR